MAAPHAGLWAYELLKLVAARNTCIKRWTSLGRTADLFLSRNRDVNAAQTFLRGATRAGAHRRDHAVRLCGIRSRGAGDEGGGPTSGQISVSLLLIPTSTRT